MPYAKRRTAEQIVRDRCAARIAAKKPKLSLTPERRAEYQRRYYLTHREKMLEYQRKYNQRKIVKERRREQTRRGNSMAMSCSAPTEPMPRSGECVNWKTVQGKANPAELINAILRGDVSYSVGTRRA